MQLQGVTGEPGMVEGAHVKNKSVLLMLDLHLYLKKAEPVFIRYIKDAIPAGRATNRSIMVMGCEYALPPELQKEFTMVEFPMPNRDELLVIAQNLSKCKNVELNGDQEQILDAGVGLTANEFADAVSYSLTEQDKVDPHVIATIKAETIKKAGMLEIVKPGVTFDNVGGLLGLKSWISKRKKAFTKEARAYGLPMPRGVCLFGVQGAGKSFATKAIAAELGCPLLKLDAGKLFGGLVGSSEANVRSVIAQVEAFGACCLQIDEIDKGFAGMVGGSSGDSGTTRRVIGTFLTWMQEKKSPVFIIATANDLTQLPPELLRNGRWDELFFIDLPTFDEREQIWEVQIRKNGRDPMGFDLKDLASATGGWTGAEIESLFGEGMYAAFEMGKEPDTELLCSLSKDTMPLSKTMAEPIARLREWAQGRSRSASWAEPPSKEFKATMARRFA